MDGLYASTLGDAMLEPSTLAIYISSAQIMAVGSALRIASSTLRVLGRWAAWKFGEA